MTQHLHFHGHNITEVQQFG